MTWKFLAPKNAHNQADGAAGHFHKAVESFVNKYCILNSVGHNCQSKSTCAHPCCKGRSVLAVLLTIIAKTGNVEQHKLSCEGLKQNDCNELSEDDFWGQDPVRTTHNIPTHSF